MEKALALYRDILKTDPDDLQALRALGRLYQATEKWQDLAKVIERQLVLCANDALGVRRAEVLAGRRPAEAPRGSGGRGRGVSRRRCRSIPNHAGARAALEGYLGAKKHQMAAVAALEPIYEALHEIERLIEVQRIKLKREKNSAGEGRSAACASACSRPRPAGPEAAYEAYAAAFTENPASSDARAALEQLAESMGKWDALVALYTEAQAKQKLEPALEREILLVVAVAYDEKLEPVGQGGRVLPHGAGDRARGRLGARGPGAAVHAHRALARPGRDPEEEGRAGAVGRGARGHSRAHRDAFWKRPSAIPTRRSPPGKRCWATTRAACAALRALDRLFVQKGMALDLADNLQRQLELAVEPEQQVTLLWRLGQLREQQLERRLGGHRDLPPPARIRARRTSTPSRRWRTCWRSPSTSSRWPSCWSRCTAAAATSPIWCACSRSRRATRPTCGARSSFCTRSRRRARTASTIRRAPTRRSAGRWPRIPSTARPRPGPNGWPRRLGQCRRPGRHATVRRCKPCRPTRPRTPSSTSSPGWPRTSWAAPRFAADAYQQALATAPRDMEAADALEAHLHPPGRLHQPRACSCSARST